MLEIRLVLLTATLIETITLLLRFGLNIEMGKIIQGILKKLGWKKMIRVHHFFLGLIIALVGFFINQLFFNVGLGIALSDLVHHIILKIVKSHWDFNLIERV